MYKSKSSARKDKKIFLFITFINYSCYTCHQILENVDEESKIDHGPHYDTYRFIWRFQNHH